MTYGVRMTTKQGRDLGYSRISLETERSGSISKQTGRIRAAVTADGGDPEALVWFEDRSVSGSKVLMKDRPGGGALLREVRQGDRVHITNLDRAARNVRDLLNIVETISGAGAEVRFIDNRIDTGGASGKLVLTILGAIAEFEAALIAERRKASLESFAVEGRHAVGKAPIGFRSVENPNGRGLVIEKDPETAPAVRDAVLRVMAGESQNTVRHSLGLSKTGFHSLLNNPRLAGMTPQNGGVVMVDGVPLVSPNAAILSPVEWRELRGFMSRNASKSWSRQKGYGRALACGECDSRLYVNVSKRRA
jgi:DNA invertase Pin-like site-specific DNA recombinase